VKTGRLFFGGYPDFTLTHREKKQMVTFKEITTEICKQRLRELLSLFVGRGKKFSRDELALITGFERETIDKYLTGESMPCVAKLFRLFLVIDEPHFTNGMMELAGFTGAARMQDDGQAFGDGLRLASSVCRFMAAVTKNRSDGKLTPREELEEADIAGQEAHKLLDFAAQARRKHGKA
jgi:hypothetical protein